MDERTATRLPDNSVSLMHSCDDAAKASIRDLEGHTVSWVEISGGARRGAIGLSGARTIVRGVEMASKLGIPIVGYFDSSGADVREGVSALHAWGTIGKALIDASGVVPIIVIVDGPCVSGPALLLGIADIVILTSQAFAYLSSPDAIFRMTGQRLERETLGGPNAHDTHTGVASFCVGSPEEAVEMAAQVLSYLPPNYLADPPMSITDDVPERGCTLAARTVPEKATASYDVRTVVRDVMDADSFLELRPNYAPNMVTAFVTLNGRPVGVVANQPMTRAGTIDIEASRKAARFVQMCDCFNLPIITFVDTPGFEPGKDLEWRGMIRHGAELVYAYADATVPRLSLVLRKAYGGAYIVMDSAGLGSDWCAAWPNAEIAVMGAEGAVQILYRKALGAIEDPEKRMDRQGEIIQEYKTAFNNPWRAAERGFIDAVIAPEETRERLGAALLRLATKKASSPKRKHGNGPL